MIGAGKAYYERVEAFSSTAKYRAEIAALAGAVGIRRGMRVLDVGCGTGAVVAWLGALGVRPLGIDRGVAWADCCAGRPVVQADAGSLPLRAGSFDAVLLVHVLAHLADPGRALAEAARVLRGGGALGVLTPDAEYLAAVGRPPGYLPDPTVERHLDRRELACLLARAGLEVRVEPLGAPLAGAADDRIRERLVAVGVKRR